MSLLPMATNLPLLVFTEETAADGGKGQDKSRTDDDQQSQNNGTYETVGLS